MQRNGRKDENKDCKEEDKIKANRCIKEKSNGIYSIETIFYCIANRFKIIHKYYPLHLIIFVIINPVFVAVSSIYFLKIVNLPVFTVASVDLYVVGWSIIAWSNTIMSILATMIFFLCNIHEFGTIGVFLTFSMGVIYWLLLLIT